MGLELDNAATRGRLVSFLREETRNAGFQRGVFGLSGGIDSAVVASLATEAMGKENVRAVIMPYRTSNPRSRADAEMLAAELGIASEVVDITPMVDAFFQRAGEMNDVRRGNVMARARMIVLYDISSRDRALVFGTSNKTEILLGYGTIYGDTACALNPLGDLYKTQVRQLAVTLGVPDQIIRKNPSADLWAGQTDEGEMGLTYAEADRLLHAMIDERRDRSDLVAMGFSAEFIERVQKMIEANRFKSRPPLIARIGS